MTDTENTAPPNAEAGIFRFRPQVEAELARYFPDNDSSPLNQYVRYALFPGGKRIRPLLCIASFFACQPTPSAGWDPDSSLTNRLLPAILPVACGIELLHTFSLIQDDLPAMDNDALRRGKPTLHLVAGQAPALLTSDALFARAFESFANAPIPPVRRLRIITEVAQAIGSRGMTAGQLLDIAPEKQLNPRMLRTTHYLKTARLIAVSLKSGAIAAGAQKPVINCLERAGTLLGLLFQITDDLLDCNDFSYTTLYGAARTRWRAERYTRAYERQLDRIKSQLAEPGFHDLRALGSMILERVE